MIKGITSNVSEIATNSISLLVINVVCFWVQFCFPPRGGPRGPPSCPVSFCLPVFETLFPDVMSRLFEQSSGTSPSGDDGAEWLSPLASAASRVLLLHWDSCQNFVPVFPSVLPSRLNEGGGGGGGYTGLTEHKVSAVKPRTQTQHNNPPPPPHKLVQ